MVTWPFPPRGSQWGISPTWVLLGAPLTPAVKPMNPDHVFVIKAR